MAAEKKIIVVAGARPNFMKIAPLVRHLKKIKQIKTLLVHTGQHYDFQMSEVFFQELNIPAPDIHLNVGSGSHAAQTAHIMTAFEKVIVNEKPDLIVVVGDVNSTVACSIVASKMNVKVAHIEAGLRSFDRTMPEEINRIITDSISDYLFVSEESGLKNLAKEGVSKNKVYYVGNIMIDTLLFSKSKIDSSQILKDIGLAKKSYATLTLHRPSNVDSAFGLSEVYEILTQITKRTKIVYAIHPRTRKMMESHGFLKKFEGITGLMMIDPLGYMDFIKLVKESKFILTDSGGIQEESTVLDIPCLTMRENTERPATVSRGTNVLVGRDKKLILNSVNKILDGRWKKRTIPRYWDGHAAPRIVNILNNNLR